MARGICRALPEDTALRRKGHLHLALIRRPAIAPDQPCGFEALEEGREGARIELQGASNVLDPSRLVLPEQQHDEVLKLLEDL